MKTRLLNLWDGFQGSFWLLPTILVLSAATLGLLIPAAEQRQILGLGQLRWLGTTPEGARSAMSGIAAAMISVAGVVFSVTMVTLSIASSQFGSRVLRNRMRDRATQLALGAFLGTSVYCFLVLTTIRGTDGSQFVPHLAVGLGIAAAVAAVFVLIYFIHDVAEVIQAPYVVARLADDLNDSIERLFPNKLGKAAGELPEGDGDAGSNFPDGTAATIESDQEGYLQAIDGQSLLDAASDHDLVLRLRVRPGDFIASGDPIAEISPDGTGSGQLAARINGAMIVGNMRTPRQDVNCAIHELAQLTVRALSPGINDPFTAMNGIDRLSAALGRLAQREIPPRFRRDANGCVRVIVERVALPEALAAAFHQIRQNARGAPPVGVRILEGLESIARKARRESDRQAILQHASMVLETFQNADHLDADLRGINDQFERVKRFLESEGKRDEGWAGASFRKDGHGDNADADDADTSSPPPAKGEVNG